MTPEEFVRRRVIDQDLPAPVADTFDRLLDLSDRIRDDGNTDDALSWITGTAVAKVGEYVFGADPASDAARIRDELHAILAATWKDHPEYDAAWSRPDGR